MSGLLTRDFVGRYYRQQTSEDESIIDVTNLTVKSNQNLPNKIVGITPFPVCDNGKEANEYQMSKCIGHKVNKAN